MAELILRLGKRLVISRRNKCLRTSFVVLVTNLMIIAALIFTVELAFILLGLGNIFFPFHHHTLEILLKLFI